MKLLYLLFFCLLILISFTDGVGQTLPMTRSVDWTLAGLRDTTTQGFVEIDMQTKGVVGDGTTPNDSVLSSVFNSITGPGTILKFPAGNFLFNKTIDVPGNMVIRGQGPDNTIFTMDLGGSGHSFRIMGSVITSDTTSIVVPAAKDSSFIMVADTSGFLPGNWVKIIQVDTDLVTSSWAYNTVGQIVQIKSRSKNSIKLLSPLRMDYDTARHPYIMKLDPAKNVGFECLKIMRIDDTAPSQTSNLYFYAAVNCWVNGVESEKCTYSHIQTRRCANINVSGSYFHHAFSYGGNGRGYGVMLHETSNECRVENNVFEHLRHSMIVQAGANGNVFAYNYSLDPYWDSPPSNSAGDMVLHGNYVYTNLFEQNICQNIVIDNSHGPNGPYNTFFRNRAESFGIFFSATNSPNQNLIGNEIPNKNFPYSQVNYNIQGSGHFIYGNNNKGTIDPAGTSTLPDTSYAYAYRPDFVPAAQWAGIGTPNNMGSNFVPAYDRQIVGKIFAGACGNALLAIESVPVEQRGLLIFPNPIQGTLSLTSDNAIEQVTVTDALGNIVYKVGDVGLSHQINTAAWNSGMYCITIRFADEYILVRKVVKAGCHW